LRCRTGSEEPVEEVIGKLAGRFGLRGSRSRGGFGKRSGVERGVSRDSSEARLEDQEAAGAGRCRKQRGTDPRSTQNNLGKKLACWSGQRSSVNPRKPERSEGSVGVQRPVGRRLSAMLTA
jgi:hypothetical protein